MNRDRIAYAEASHCRRLAQDGLYLGRVMLERHVLRPDALRISFDLGKAFVNEILHAKLAALAPTPDANHYHRPGTLGSGRAAAAFRGLASVMDFSQIALFFRERLAHGFRGVSHS